MQTLTKDQKIAVLLDPRPQRSIARDYGITQARVSHIKKTTVAPNSYVRGERHRLSCSGR